MLGRYPDIPLQEARELARQHRGSVQQGIDIAAERRAAKLEATEQDDVAALAQAWYERHIGWLNRDR